MQLFKKTIEPKTEYKFKSIAGKVYLYDGEQELFKITKIYSFAEFIEEYFENECLDILEIFECDGETYIYFLDEEYAPSDYITKVPEIPRLRFLMFLHDNLDFLFDEEDIYNV